MTHSTPARIMLVDDHDLVRAGIRALLGQLPGVIVVAETGQGQEAVELIRKEHPDIVFVDISMPGLNGLTLLREASEIEDVRLVVLSMYDSESYVAEALRLGASGYLLKQDASLAELELAINCVMRGGRYLTPAISTKVVDGYLRSSEQTTSVQLLTPRQREILRLIAEGNSTKEIAFKLNISVKTVESHRADVMERLDVHDVAGLVRYAIKEGIVRMP